MNKENLKKLFEKAREEMKRYETPKFPLTINGIRVGNFNRQSVFNTSDVGQWVSIRPVADEYNNKTFLGIYIGDLPIRAFCVLDKETNELLVESDPNPAIYVPDLNKVIFGYESWWDEIKSPEDLKEITDQDIENIWYVKALKQLSGE